MRGQSRRAGCLAAGVLAATVFAWGWAPKSAPARDAKTPQLGNQWLTEPQREEAARAVIERLNTEGAPTLQMEQQVVHPQSLKQAPQDSGNLYVTIGDRPVRMITSYDATPINDGGLATGGGTPNGGACTCDSQCAAAAGECHVAHCVGGVCVQENAPVDTTCSNDGQFCTEERCNDVGVCVNTNVSPSIATRISPCSKQCCTAATCTLGSFQNCFEASDCPGTEGCFPKRQAVSGQLYRAQCDETNDRCFVDRVPAATPNAAVGNPIGRCCTAGGACSLTDLAGCPSGQWWRMRDPDDSQHACNGTDGCPKYGSGIAPDGPHVTGIGPIVPPARRCSVGGNICEVNADCMARCNGGALLNEACDSDLDCPGGVCLPGGLQDICTADSEECQGPGTFTSVGDDYSLSNGSYMRLSEFRFRGGAREPSEVAIFEFYDTSLSPMRLANVFAFRFANPGDFDYRIIVDCFPNCDASQPQGSNFVENRLDPPFIIPPAGIVVMRASRLGFLNSPVSTQFGEDDGNLFWYTTDATDVGTNNPNSMWINGTVGNNPATAADILSFELVGTKIPAPVAACCDPDTGNCVDRVQWDCSFCTDPARTSCDLGRDCGLNAQFNCSTRDWKGARSAAEVIADGYKVCGQAYCHGPNAGAGTAIECTGTGQGSCAAGHVCEEACETAACCTASGCVEVSTVAECNGLSGSILGFGQRCEPNCCPQPLTGVDCCKDYFTCRQGANDTGIGCNFRCSNDANRPCSEDYECVAPGTCNVLPGTQADCQAGQTCQMICDGPNNPADPRIHVIDVPTFVSGDERVIKDFRGATGSALFTEDCASNSAGADFGHYQFFTLDECAVVTINTCCSDPLVTPVSQIVTKDCPCISGEAFFADVNTNGAQSGFGTACNNDFCCTDGNWSIKFTLPPGSYTYQIPGDKSCSNSTTNCLVDADCDPGTWCVRNNATYQGHIIAQPCSPGACCGSPADPGESFCSVTDRFTCEDQRKYCKTTQATCDDNSDCPVGDVCLQGVFLGDKEVSPVPLCVGDPCSLGACCLGPGNCTDNAGAGIGFAACNAQNGTYIGGFRCSENPCPVCPIETQDQCQTDVTGTVILPSDRLLNQRRADDFRAAGSVIRRICFYPCFIGVDGTPQGFECSGNSGGTRPPDAWIAKFYEDDNGKPGPLVAGVPGAGFSLTIDASIPTDGGAGGSRCWRYTAPIAAPNGISVTPGDCYWLEVTGLGEVQQGGTCVTQWLSSGDGNNYSMRDTNNSYALTDVAAFDQAFCIDSGIIGATSPPTSQDGGCGNFPVACCKPGAGGPTCVDGGSYQQCIGTPANPQVGVAFPFITCSQVPGGCPEPPNDDCANASVPSECVGQVTNPNLGVCSVSDGPPNISEVCDMSVGSAPRHDCVNATATCQPRPASTDAYRCGFTTDNRLATTDGPGTTGAGVCFQSGANSFQADVWYRYTAPCSGTLTIHSCAGNNNTYDMMLQVFGNHTATCSTCPVTGNTQNLACTDDGSCSTAGGGGGVRVPNVIAGSCYTIRVGGYSALGAETDAGQNISGLDVGMICNPIVSAQTPLAPSGAQAVHNRQKNRYISFEPNNGMSSVAFRVQKAAVANNAGFCTGNPGAACTGAPAQGTCPGGSLCVAPFPTGSPAHSCWVQTPIQTVGNEQFVARCEATPLFRTWTEPVVHVGDCEIIPTSSYTIFANGAGPVENPVGLVRNTIDMPTFNSKVWGDNVGINSGVEWTAPNRFTNVQDVLSLLAFISGAAIKPHFTVGNMQATSAPDSCLNPFINVADVLIVNQAISGSTYGAPSTGKITNTSTCPVCP